MAIGALVMTVGYTFLTDYFGGTEKEIAELKALLADGETTVGLMDTVYSETQYKSISLYSSKYFFTVDDKKYSGEFSFDSPDDLEMLLNVHYMKDDPTINGVYLEKEIAEAEEDANSKFDLVAGILALLIGFVLFYFSGIRRILTKPAQIDYTNDIPERNDKDEFLA